MCFIGFQRTNHNMNQSNQGEKKKIKKKKKKKKKAAAYIKRETGLTHSHSESTKIRAKV